MLNKVKINYICNSGFKVRIKDSLFIFDYYKDEINVIDINELIESKSIFVFVSHSHYDHFNEEIFNWKKYNNNIHYILSSDIKIKEEGYYYLNPYSELQIENIKVKTYGSTDEGVSFLVNVHDLNIFHAGDLNLWYWKEDTEENKNYAKDWFEKEIDNILGEDIDIAFFPVDPRLEEYAMCGGKYFIEKLRPKVFIPMHFGENFGITSEFKDIIKCKEVEVIRISSYGEEIII
ncbi:MBL fold metallo-hydrolase [Alkalithermobacter paradoxus]|uniref:Metal-dependent hydrolase n=1 Tax=Alkalithermobacter paradoxus TaxID=29349 RepID=A0A1V4I927_9FIRM|nr:metal-dependent hydrolase [[Clostridium] thermoalcaliphilum]